MHITTHVLDLTRGAGAGGLEVVLQRCDDTGRWLEIGATTTGPDGRAGWPGPGPRPAGTYAMRFLTGAYFARVGQPTCFPEVVVLVTLAAGDGHCHLPLLLGPFGYSAYRGTWSGSSVSAGE